MPTYDSEADRLLADLAATVKELDSISLANLAEERRAPKAVQDRRRSNRIRAMQESAG